MYKRLMTTLLLIIKMPMNLKRESMGLTLTFIVSITTLLQVLADPSTNTTLCVLPRCKAKGVDILKTIDFSFDPCTDMYNYSCGKKRQADLEAGTYESRLPLDEWLLKESIEDVKKLLQEPGIELRGKPSSAIKKLNDLYKTCIDDEINEMEGRKQLIELLQEQGNELRGKPSSAIKKLKDLYKTCIGDETSEMEGRKKLIEIINKFGSWSAGKGENFRDWNENTWNFQKTLEDMQVSRGHILFSVYMHYHDLERKYIFDFGQNSGVIDLKFFEDSTNVENLLSAIVRLVESLGGDPEVARIKMEEVLSFEQKVLEILEDERNPKGMYTTLEHFQTMVGDSINMTSFVSRYLNGSDFSMNDTVHLSHSTYFPRLGQLIKRTSKEILCNYMMWIYISHLPAVSYTSSLYETLNEVSTLMLGIPSILRTKSERCFDFVNKHMPMATGAIYVDRHMKAEIKNEVTDMMNEMRKQFLLILDSLDWMDDLTRTNVQERIKAMNLHIGYPDWILDPEKLDEYYERLRVDPQLVLTTIESIDEISLALNRNGYGKPRNRDRWIQSPAVMKPTMDPLFNVIFLPAVNFKNAVYDPSVSKVEKYGVLGADDKIGFPFIFLKQLRNFDKDGNAVTIWSNKTEQKLYELSECITGLNTTEEREAILTLTGSLKVAFNAYRAARLVQVPHLNITNDQLFFLAYTQTFCESSGEAKSGEKRRRAMMALSYYEEFAKAFNCAPNSPMYHRNQCHVW